MLNFFRGIYDSIIHARKLQAAFRLAEHLKAYNSDFKHWSYSELVQAIMDEEHPVWLDKTPANDDKVEQQVELAKAA